MVGSVKHFLESRSGSRRHTRLEVERQSCYCFQIFILQCIQIVNGAKNIHAKLDAQINLWNSGAFDELIYDYLAADEG